MSYKNFIDGFGFRIQQYPRTKFEQDKANILPNMQVSSLFYSVTHSNVRLPWQQLKLMRIVTMYKVTPIGVKLNLKNFTLISCGVMELLRKVSQGEGIPPGEVGL